MKNKPFVAAALIALTSTLRCVALSPGDIMVVGYNTSGTDAVSFVNWVELPINQTISIVDAEYTGGGDGSGEGPGGGTYGSPATRVWTNTSGAPIPPGTVIAVTTTGANIGSATGPLGLNLNGEQFFLIEGSISGGNLIGTLLFGIDFDANWDAGSVLPTALNANGQHGNLHYSFPGDPDEEFTAPRNNSALSAYPDQVLNMANWGPVSSGVLNPDPFVSVTTNYSPGDLMILGWDSTTPDSFNFVSWVDIPAGESIMFFDADYVGGGDGSGEGSGGGIYASVDTLEWTNNTGGPISAGTVILISDLANGTSSTDTGTTTGGFALTTAGEQFFIGDGQFLNDGSGDYFDGTLIFGVDYEGGTAWGESGESELPGALNVTGGNLTFGHQNAYEYTGARSGMSLEDYPDLVLNPVNWGALGSAGVLIGDSFVDGGPPVVIPDRLGHVNEGLLFHARRMKNHLNNLDPILDEAWSVAQGAGASNADNLNGPSCIRIPNWAAKVDPSAKYYLYFADHAGDYIRMAWAADLKGPWHGYRMDEGTYARGHRGVLDLGPDDEFHAGEGVYVDGHIASPQVFVDDANQQIVMYYHGYVSYGSVGTSRAQRTIAATSSDGLNFNMPSPNVGDARAGQPGHGTLPVAYGESYFRVFEQAGRHYSLSNTGDLYAAPEGEDPLIPDGSYNHSSIYWDKGPKPFTDETESRGWLGWAGSYGDLRPRHFGVLKRDNFLYAFLTNKAASPERIQVSTFDFANLSSDYNLWKGDFPNQELLRPEEDWEGGNLPLDISESGSSSTAAHQLRDPGILEDEGRTYMFYSGAGEKAIGISQLVSRPVVNGSTEVTTGQDHTFTVSTDIDVSPSMLKISHSTPAVIDFNAETGLSPLIYDGNSSYSVVQSSTVGEGSQSYQLAHFSANDSETLSFPHRYYARPGTSFVFLSRLASSTTGQFAEVQISFDGTIWQTIWIQQGGSADSIFRTVSIDMNGLVGRTFDLRFRYHHEPLRNGSVVSGASSGTGWFIDRIEAEGLEAVTQISEAAFTDSSFTLDRITPLIAPFLEIGGSEEERILLEAQGLHSGTGFSESTGYGKPFVIRVRDSYEDFLAANFSEAEQADPLISGDLADPDFDGQPNMLEHFHGTDPRISGGNPVHIASAGAALTFPVDPLASYIYQLQASPDLQSFTDVPFTESTTPSGSLLQTTLTPIAPTGPFFRLKVTRE